jgi:AcrR family transcriptional regulator
MQKRVGQRDLLGSAADPELSEQKQRQIVEGAKKVLLAEGFHGTSIRDIAQACGMSMGQLYHYISSKDDILFLMHLHSQELWHQHLAEGGFDAIGDPVAKLEHGLRISIRFLSENRELIRFIHNESKYMDQEHLEKALDLDDKNVVGFYRHLLAEIPGLALQGREAELAANLVSFMCVFLPLRGWNLHITGPADVDEIVDFLVDFIFRGLGIERVPGTERGTEQEEASAC